ncbi:rCG27747 [Rattus norvegicus]|uniref:RCG27747 n=1 Tax=Rattus norvegicus TaxID=10116 RepID=A6KBC3_RAT|nr:rCG27747 [Rattus norvegicus]
MFGVNLRSCCKPLRDTILKSEFQPWSHALGKKPRCDSVSPFMQWRCQPCLRPNRWHGAKELRILPDTQVPRTWFSFRLFSLRQSLTQQFRLASDLE